MIFYACLRFCEKRFFFVTKILQKKVKGGVLGAIETWTFGHVGE